MISKSPPFVKLLFFIILTLIIVTISNKLILKKSDCLFVEENLKNRNFYAKVMGQNIDIIGWYHGTVERDVAQNAMAEAINYGEIGNCRLAQEKIESALKRLEDQKNENLRVLKILNDIYSKRQFKKLGVEYGPEQYREEFIHPNSIRHISTELILNFEKLCPEQIQQFSDLYLIFPGPEYRFILDKKGLVEIVPLGNDELIKKSLLIYSNESRFLNQQKNKLSSQARQAFSQFIELTKDGHAITQAKLLELVVNLKEPEKSKLRKYFNEVNEVFKLIIDRDHFYVEEILKTKSDLAIVIGNFHVLGIRDKLKTKCEIDKNSK